MSHKGPATAPALSVIIVSHKCRSLLVQCLESLLADRWSKATEIIVVDNASADGSVEEVRAQYPQVALIENGENVGFPAANNQALRIARGNAFLLLNPDTVVTEGAISRLVDFFEREPVAKIVGLNVRNADGSAQNTVHRSLPTAAQFLIAQIGLPDRFGGKWAGDERAVDDAALEPELVAWVSGAALAFSRPVLDAVGFLDESMFWAEDLDFCVRASDAHVPVYYLPSARILHYSGESGKRNYRRMLYAQHASRIVFAERHYGGVVSLALRAILALVLPVKMGVRFAQLWRPSRRSEIRERLAGYWDALKFCVSWSSSVERANRA
jgi:GT2 family glycosyltransferase